MAKLILATSLSWQPCDLKVMAYRFSKSVHLEQSCVPYLSSLHVFS